MSIELVTVVGARPQFIKASAVSRAIRGFNERSAATLHETIIHTGQHYDSNMSEVFFKELDIQRPDYELNVANCSHGAMTGRMIEGVEARLLADRPDLVLVYGDTNSTLAGALAAAKLNIPVAHVEAGLRSWNRRMPEEINRILTDQISSWLFCPTVQSVANLAREGMSEGVVQVGDVMFDATLHYAALASSQYQPEHWGVNSYSYILCTIHRAENTDNPDRLREIVAALGQLAKGVEIVMPIHPRTRARLEEFKLGRELSAARLIDPVSYLQMLSLEKHARAIITDSGGVQKEAYFCRVPCITVRDETEWVETVAMGWNKLVEARTAAIVAAVGELDQFSEASSEQPYGSGDAANRIVQFLVDSQSH